MADESIIAMYEHRIAILESENFALSANQCHAGYGDDWGNHRCGEIDKCNEQIKFLKKVINNCVFWLSNSRLDTMMYMASSDFYSDKQDMIIKLQKALNP